MVLAEVTPWGHPTYTGLVDLRPTLHRIAKGGKHPHHRDGTPFENRKNQLPRGSPKYYTEHVHPTPGINGPGPQRIVTGANGEVYYTPDHYATFVRIN